jgi:hypothetical protein
LKNGDSIKGTLEGVDNFMNIKFKDGIYTTNNASSFYKVPLGFIRGNNITSFQFKEGLLEKLEDMKEKEKAASLVRNIIYFYNH